MSNAEIRQFDALAIPVDALEKGGIEILRASVVDGELHVTLRRAFEQPEHWGGLLSELVHRIARAYAADGKMKETDVVARIRSSFSGSGKTTKPAAKQKSAKKAAKNAASKAARGRKKKKR